ncbi:MAG: hypothetical protein PHO93_02695 [Candidatus Saccharimonadaceae bacterium]|nr:hypothetical protein [Candidatus Saccharimonadaceae bacterium]
MVKKSNKNESNIKSIKKILLYSPVVVLGLVILYMAGSFVSASFFEKSDQDRFVMLDSRMRSLYNQIKSVAGENDDWKYAAVCSEEMSGDFPTGEYNCVTSISMRKTITSVEELNVLHAKYYPVINNSGSLSSKTELDVELPDDFGNNFVVSSAEKRLVEKDSNIECNYLTKLGQGAEDYSSEYDSYGSKMLSDIGRITISLRCEDISRGSWYQLVDDTDMLIP